MEGVELKYKIDMKKVLTRNVTTIIGAVGFKVPTEAEWEAEFATWDTQDAAGAFGGVLKLTMGGLRGLDVSPVFVGSGGFYYSSTVSSPLCLYLYFDSGTAFMTGTARGIGFSVRLIKEGTFESHTPETITIEGLEYQTVYNPTTQRVWLDRNLGATQVAESSTDSDAYGWLYQWGRGTDGHQLRTSGTTAILSITDQPGHGDFILAPDSPNDWRDPQNDDLWQGVEGINNPATTTTTVKKILTRNGKVLVRVLPPEESGFKVPTEAEWTAEIATWDTQDAAGAFGGVLKLPVGGNRNVIDGSLVFVDSLGVYYSSTVDGTPSKVLSFDNSIADMNNRARAVGSSVRLIKEGTFETHTPEIITIEGMTYNTVYNPTTQRVWLDRNLGATQVAESSTDSDAYGWLYQWGRGTDGHQIRTSGTTAILSETDQPGHGDFIITFNPPFDWRDPQNDNLWQGVEGINNPANP